MVVNETLLVDCVRSVLAHHDANDWQVEPDGFWCAVRPPSRPRRVQGWKLHLSATPLSAPLVLARSAGVLVRHRCSFKFARTLDTVTDLVSARYDRGAGGKFLTVYPDGDDHALRTLAEELHEATVGLPGPGILSDRPYRPGSLVHYRYGAFRGVPMLSNDGTYEAMLVAPDGALALDRREAWFAPPSWVPREPCAAEPAGPAPAAASAPRTVLLDGRYAVREVIRHAFTGGVYRATDQDTEAPVILKQARPHTGAGVTGRDIRDARRHEARMLEVFAPSGRTPRPVGVFEQQGDLFLVQEEIPGVTLRRWVSEQIAPDDGGAWGLPPAVAARLAGRLVDLLGSVHANGFVVRDFSPNNVMVTPDGDLRLIDLEMLARPGDRVNRAYTPGYAAPEQVRGSRFGAAPPPTADLYSLGATLFYLVSGVDPLLPRDEPEERPDSSRIEVWLGHLGAGNAAARLLSRIIVALLDQDPARRPNLDTVRELAVRELIDATPEASGAPASPGRLADADLKRLVDDALDHLVATMHPIASADTGEPERLWPSEGFAATTDPLNVQHGAAGVLGVLTRAYATAPEPRLRAAVATAADWIARRITREPRTLPGLYFGRSGTAWALLEAGGALGDDRLLDLAVDLARRIPVRWPNPDVCHGTAGAGLTQLRFWEITGADDFLDRARQAADAVCAAAEQRDGAVLWPIPHDFASALAGVVHFGFAHGVAGAGAFLLAAGRATGETRYSTLAAAAADTLRSVVEVDRGAAFWPSGVDGGPPRTNWCSGSSGVGTFAVRLWQHTGEDHLLELATQAALAVRRSRWQEGTAQCHGLAGDGEFLLDLADATGDERYRDWAEELALSIHVRNTLRDGRMLVPDETGTTVVADFGTGLAGVLAFLLRLRDGGRRLWLPDSISGPDNP